MEKERLIKAISRLLQELSTQKLKTIYQFVLHISK